MPASKFQLLHGTEPTHYVVSNDATVFVKEAAFFIEQGGLTQKWGRNWKPVVAPTIGTARRIGAELFGIKLSPLYDNEDQRRADGYDGYE